MVLPISYIVKYSSYTIKEVGGVATKVVLGYKI